MTNPPLQSQVLKACPNPWCKHDPDWPPEVARRIASTKVYVRCGDCGMDGPNADTEAEAITAWNHRIESTPPTDEEPGRVPADVVRLVVAARGVAFELAHAPLDQGDHDALAKLDAASEAFAGRVPWGDEPTSRAPAFDPAAPTDEEWIEAVAREREECAKVADSFAQHKRDTPDDINVHLVTATDIAEAIRARAVAAIPRPSPANGGDAVARAEAWLRQCSTWLLANDLDMTCPMEADPLDIADDLASLTPPDDRIRVAKEALKKIAAGQVVLIDHDLECHVPETLYAEDMQELARTALTRLQGEP